MQKTRATSDGDSQPGRSQVLAKSIGASFPDNYLRAVERVVKKSRGFGQADRWDVLQNISLTPQERIRIAHALRKRAFPPTAKDVRAWHHAS